MQHLEQRFIHCARFCPWLAISGNFSRCPYPGGLPARLENYPCFVFAAHWADLHMSYSCGWVHGCQRLETATQPTSAVAPCAPPIFHLPTNAHANNPSPPRARHWDHHTRPSQQRPTPNDKASHCGQKDHNIQRSRNFRQEWRGNNHGTHEPHPPPHRQQAPAGPSNTPTHAHTHTNTHGRHTHTDTTTNARHTHQHRHHARTHRTTNTHTGGEPQPGEVGTRTQATRPEKAKRSPQPPPRHPGKTRKPPPQTTQRKGGRNENRPRETQARDPTSGVWGPRR